MLVFGMPLTWGLAIVTYHTFIVRDWRLSVKQMMVIVALWAIVLTGLSWIGKSTYRYIVRQAPEYRQK